MSIQAHARNGGWETILWRPSHRCFSFLAAAGDVTSIAQMIVTCIAFRLGWQLVQLALGSYVVRMLDAGSAFRSNDFFVFPDSVLGMASMNQTNLGTMYCLSR